jgi:hypothetical protein
MVGKKKLTYCLSKQLIAFNNYFLLDKNLSLAAKGLLGFFLTLPNKWEFSNSFIAKRFNISPGIIKKLLEELENKKYTFTEEVEKKVFYYFFDVPYDSITNSVAEYTCYKNQIDSLVKKEKKSNNKREKKIKEYDPESEEYKLAEYFLNKILEIDPGKREPNLHIWAGAFPKMRYVDGIYYNQIKNIINWVFKNNYWRDRITSPSKLQWNLGIIRTQMRTSRVGTYNNSSSNNEDIEDWLRE